MDTDERPHGEVQGKKKRRKRGKAKAALTHFKSGSSRGRPTRRKELKVVQDDTEVEEPDLSQTSESPQVLESPYSLESPQCSSIEQGGKVIASPTTDTNHDLPSTSVRVSPPAIYMSDVGESLTEISVSPTVPSQIDESYRETLESDELRETHQLEPPPNLKANLTSSTASNTESNSQIHENLEGPVTKPGQELVLDIISKLQRRIHLPWLIISEDDGINVLLLSRCHQRAVQRRFFFSFSGKEEISVHQRTPSESVMQDILKRESSDKIVLSEDNQDEFVERIVTVINRLRLCEVCVGVSEEEFKPLWGIDKSGEVDKNPWCEARYIETFRHSNCELLVPTTKYFKRRCKICIQTKIRFRKKLPHHMSSKAPPNTPNIHLDRDQLIDKVEMQQKQLTYAKAQIKTLKARLSEAIEKSGVPVGKEFSDDLCNILSDAKLTPVQALFFEQQLKAVNAKKACGHRWHPTLIRFALLLRSTSAAAYRAVQDSGVIVLPSERTLYDYSHVMSAEAGCTEDKLNRIAKIVLDKYPEPYQRYHVLLVDEMYINQKLVYLKSTGQMIGCVNLTDAEKEMCMLEAELSGEKVSDSPPLASKILTFMVKGVASSVCEVVASFPTTDSFDCEKLYDKTWEVIGALERSGLRVIAIVSDGASTNRAFYAMHTPLTPTESGVIFDTINLCAPSRPLYFISDVPHLLKTIRNCFYKSGSGRKCTRLLTKNGQVIVWETIRKLYEEDRSNTVRRCFKLNSNNVFLNAYSVMKVSYAAEVLSMSVALDLESRNWPGTSETVKFLKLVNDFFDMLNGASSFQGKRKANPNLDSYRDVNDERFKKLEDFLQYLNEWKAAVTNKTGFTKAEKAKMMLSQQTLDGIELTVRAFTGATHFLLSEGVKFLNARVFCQDPLERYFRKQRQSGGGSRNPTVANFLRNEVKISMHRDMIVRKGNVECENQGMQVSNEPLPKRARVSS